MMVRSLWHRLCFASLAAAILLPSTAAAQLVGHVKVYSFSSIDTSSDGTIQDGPDYMWVLSIHDKSAWDAGTYSMTDSKCSPPNEMCSDCGSSWDPPTDYELTRTLPNSTTAYFYVALYDDDWSQAADLIGDDWTHPTNTQDWSSSCTWNNNAGPNRWGDLCIDNEGTEGAGASYAFCSKYKTWYTDSSGPSAPGTPVHSDDAPVGFDNDLVLNWSWTAASDPNTGIDYYEFYFYNDTTGSYLISAALTTATSVSVCASGCTFSAATAEGNRYSTIVYAWNGDYPTITNATYAGSGWSSEVYVQKANGASCGAGNQCKSGNCVDGYCCNSACNGFCQACDLSGSLGTCANVPNGQDPDGECSSDACNKGVCNGSGACASESAGTDCGTCKTCNGSGVCNQTPADDADCGTIQCSTLSNTCRTYNNITSNRCSGFGTCKTVDATNCNSYSDANSGTRCGLCMACNGGGACSLMPEDDATCGVIDCDGLDSPPCGNYSDLDNSTGKRCAGLGSCKTANSAGCTVHQDAVAGTDCGLCKACNGSGSCSAKPDDDADCGQIDCNGLDTACRDYSPISGSRCADFGTCKTATATYCTNYVNSGSTTKCGACKTCDGGGSCTNWPEDDAACGQIECDGLDTACRDFSDLDGSTGKRCGGFGQCKEPNSAGCGVFANKGSDVICGTCVRCNGSGGCSNFTAANTDPDDQCPACQTCGGTTPACANVSDGQDPLGECQAQPCSQAGYYYGWESGTCYYDGASYGAACGGGGSCRPAQLDCTGAVKGESTGVSFGVCRIGRGCSARTVPSVEVVTDGTSCDDGLYCNGVEFCRSGNCYQGTPVSCNDGKPCTSDDCDDDLDACRFDPLDEGAPCGDGLFCTGEETCAGGECVEGPEPDCEDFLMCTTDDCDEGNDGCRNVPNDSLCDNGKWCDGAEECDTLEGCVPGAAPDCSVLESSCSAARCDEFADRCELMPVQDGTACDDIPNAAGQCTDGACAFVACNEGFMDRDGNIVNGCECPVTAGDELCDGIDNDCDGATDETFPDKGKPCEAGSGDCRAEGTFECSADGRSTACSATPPVGAAETCNGMDDDCDGVADEMEETCTAGELCACGACASACGVGGICPEGFSCRMGLCLQDSCCGVRCEAGLACMAGNCADRCAAVRCAAGTYCELGECVPFDCRNGGAQCPQGKICLEGECADDPCAGVACPAGQYCRRGECLRPCVEGRCAGGGLCAEGTCVPDPCSGVRCPAPLACVGGACGRDPCEEVYCPAGEICIEGACKDDPCKLISCPSGAACREGQCWMPSGYDAGAPDASGRDGALPDASTPSDDGGSDGGKPPPFKPPSGVVEGGCGCTSGGGAAGVLGMIFAVLAIMRMRSRKRA